MTNLEHLLENGLRLMGKVGSPKEWYREMGKDVNWQGIEHITLTDLWTICQYVVYVLEKESKED